MFFSVTPSTVSASVETIATALYVAHARRVIILQRLSDEVFQTVDYTQVAQPWDDQNVIIQYEAEQPIHLEGVLP